MPRTTLQKRSLETIDSENLYTLSINRLPQKTLIIMRLLIPQVNTKDFPGTVQLLNSYLPSILQSACYNDDHLPFYKEVSQTEVGHLFEHMLLEFLCLVKLENGVDTATFQGVTDWNWIREPKGTFHITIHATLQELDILSEALSRTIKLMNIILTHNENVSVELSIPALTTRH